MNAVNVLHLHRWNSHTSTSNINMCCIGYLGKEGERGGKRVHLWFLKADNDVDVQSAVWHWMRSNRRIQSSFFFWKRSLGSYFFSHMCLSIFCLIWLFFNLWHLNWSKSIKNDQKMSWRRIPYCVDMYVRFIHWPTFFTRFEIAHTTTMLQFLVA